MSNENKAEDFFRTFKEGLGEFGQKVNRMVDDLMTGESEAGDLRIRADVYELKNELVLEIELPGVEKNEVNLQIHDGILSVKGEKKRLSPEEAMFFNRERRYGKFMRNFPLPEYVELQDIKARYETGILIIRMPINRPEEEEETDSSTDIIID